VPILCDQAMPRHLPIALGLVHHPANQGVGSRLLARVWLTLHAAEIGWVMAEVFDLDKRPQRALRELDRLRSLARALDAQTVLMSGPDEHLARYRQELQETADELRLTIHAVPYVRITDTDRPRG
jgi:hypothetical protein